MRQISEKVRRELANDLYYRKCCLCGYTQGKIEWHHQLIQASRQVDEKYAILPLCLACHLIARKSETKERLDLIMLNRMTDEQITAISKANDWHQRKKYLTNKYAP